MSLPALLNLVRYETLADDDALDYVSGAPVLGRRDEIELVDANGVPSATPIAQTKADLDYTYNYANGNIGRNARMNLHQINLGIDYIVDDIRRKLDQWKQERATMFFTPGFGRNTALAWRPIDCNDTFFGDGETLTDLTGQHEMTCAGTLATVWDDATSRFVMGGPTSDADGSLILATPAGAGQHLGVTGTNRAIPGSPESATEGYGAGNAGWEKALGAGSQTWSLISNGFGHTDCPHSLLVVSTLASANSLSMKMDGIWDSGSGDYEGHTFTGAGSIYITVWIKGRIESPIATLQMFQDGQAGLASRDLTGLDLRDWTPVTVALYKSDWSLGHPIITLGFSATTNDAQVAFEVGASCVAHDSSVPPCGLRKWAPGTATPTAWNTAQMSSAAMRYPAAGSLFHSFWLPEDFDPVNDAEAIGGGYHYIGIMFWGNVRLYISYAVDGKWYIYWRTSSAVTRQIEIPAAVAGVNTVAQTWDNKNYKSYFNGVLINTRTLNSDDLGLEAGDEVTGHSYYPGYGNWGSESSLMLQNRIDDRVFTDNEIAYLHTAAVDPGALGVIVPARGRLYEIVSIPSSPEGTAEGTIWRGNLVLRQRSYNHNLADLTSQEVV